VPVVCSNHFGNKEIIKNGVNGYVFKSYDHLKDILSDLLSNPQKLLDLKISTRKHFIEHIDIRHSIDKYLKLINKTVSNFPMSSSLGAGAKAKRLKSKRTVITRPIKPKSKRPIKKFQDKKTIHNMKENDKFSILTACYNNEEFLDDWAKSILCQAHRPLEVVFVDDASTDGSRKKIKSIIPKFKKAGIDFRLIEHNQRNYCATSYSWAVYKAEGDFFGVVDADDMLGSEAVSFIMGIYKKYPHVGWIYTQFQFYDNKMRKKGRGFCGMPSKGQSLLSAGMKGKHLYSHWRTFSRRVPKPKQIFKKGLRASVDKYMGYRLEEISQGMYVNSILYHYRQGVKKSISVTEKARAIWKQVIKEAQLRRTNEKIKPKPIAKYRG
jgi:glycosyltransferase involved in cell wall biosynthesis